MAKDLGELIIKLGDGSSTTEEEDLAAGIQEVGLDSEAYLLSPIVGGQIRAVREQGYWRDTGEVEAYPAHTLETTKGKMTDAERILGAIDTDIKEGLRGVAAYRADHLEQTTFDGNSYEPTYTFKGNPREAAIAIVYVLLPQDSGRMGEHMDTLDPTKNHALRERIPEEE